MNLNSSSFSLPLPVELGLQSVARISATIEYLHVPPFGTVSHRRYIELLELLFFSHQRGIQLVDGT